MKIRTYYVKKQKRTKTKEEIAREEKEKYARRKAIKLKLRFADIDVSDSLEEMTEEEKAMNCLLYRFKRCNNYYNLLYSVYLEDNSKQDFFNLCYIVTKEAKDKSNFKALYKNMQKELETETCVRTKTSTNTTI